VFRWLAIVAALAQGAAHAPFDVARLGVAPPIPITELNRTVLRGERSRLAWSPDGSLVYVQSSDGVADRARLRHFSLLNSVPAVRADSTLQ
jgi:hypothetical protein